LELLRFPVHLFCLGGFADISVLIQGITAAYVFGMLCPGPFSTRIAWCLASWMLQVLHSSALEAASVVCCSACVVSMAGEAGQQCTAEAYPVQQLQTLLRMHFARQDWQLLRRLGMLC
jgi:hypothetical protein